MNEWKEIASILPTHISLDFEKYLSKAIDKVINCGFYWGFYTRER